MVTDSSARVGPGTAGESDYRSFCAALSESARGRDFLAEFARRNRHADTEMLLAALDRLEALMRADGTALERLRDELRMLLIAIRLARPDIDAASPPTKMAKLATLLDMLERRIDALVEGNPVGGKAAGAAPPAEINAGAPSIEISRPPLSVVPLSDEPELPIPSPASAQPAIALVQDYAQKNNVRVTTAMSEVALIASAPAAPVEVDVPAPKAAAVLPPADPLAAIMALSEDERIALFT